MWSITILKEKHSIIHTRFEDLHDAIREGQRIANKKNAVVSVHKKGGHYKIVHPQRKVIKCTLS